MKKLYPLLLCVGLALSAKSQCAVDSMDNFLGLLPPDTFLPVIVQGVFYDTTVQAYSPDSVTYLGTTSYIYWTNVDTILGLPTGITYSRYPNADTIPRGGRQCIHFSGTTTDTPGVYQLVFMGTIQIASPFLGGSDTVMGIQALDSDLLDFGVNAIFGYALFVQAAPPPPPACSVDSPTLSAPGVSPVASELPCIVQTVPYNQTVQGKIQSSGTITVSGVSVPVTVDSVKLDSIAGLPANITWGVYPSVLPGGAQGCINFSGTTTDTTGTYSLNAYGTVWFTGTIAGQSGEYPYTGNLNQFSPFGGYYLRVVGSGDSCVLTAGIHNYSNSLNAEVSVYPNPTSGLFELRMNAASPVNGKIFVFDELGQQVFEQSVEALGVYTTSIDLSKFGSGLYTLQIRTPQGNVSKKISVQ